MAREQQTRRREMLQERRRTMKVRLSDDQFAWLYEQAGKTEGWGVSWILRNMVDAARGACPQKQEA